MLGISSPPTTMQGRLHRIQRGSTSSSSLSIGWCTTGIVQADDLVVDFDRVGDQDRVLIHAQHALGQAGFAVAGGAVDEDRILRNDGRAELIEHAVGHDQVGERAAEDSAVDVDFARPGPWWPRDIP